MPQICQQRLLRFRQGSALLVSGLLSVPYRSAYKRQVALGGAHNPLSRPAGPLTTTQLEGGEGIDLRLLHQLINVEIFVPAMNLGEGSGSVRDARNAPCDKGLKFACPRESHRTELRHRRGSRRPQVRLQAGDPVRSRLAAGR